MSVVTLNELIDLGNEFFDTFKGSPANRFLSNQIEPNLNLIEPKSIVLVEWN